MLSSSFVNPSFKKYHTSISISGLSNSLPFSFIDYDWFETVKKEGINMVLLNDLFFFASFASAT